MNRNTLVLLGVFAALLVVAYFILQSPGEKSKDIENRNFLAEIDSAQTDKIEFVNYSGKITIEKKNGNWQIVSPLNYPADVGRVAAAIQSCAAVRIKNVVSGNPEKREDYGLDSASAIKLKLYQAGKQMINILIGNNASSGSDSYIMESDDSRVVLVKGNLNGVFSAPLANWRDKTIFRIVPDSLRKVEFISENENFSLVRNSGDWFIDGIKVETEIIESFFKYLCDYRTDLFEDKLIPDAADLKRQIKINGVCLDFYNAAEDKWLVRSSASDQTFMVMKWKASLVLKDKADFFPED